MINAGTVAAYLTLETSDFQKGLDAAGKQLSRFEEEHSTQVSRFGGVFEGVGSVIFNGVTQPVIGAGTAALALASHFDSATASIRNDVDNTGTAVKATVGKIGEYINSLNNADDRKTNMKQGMNDIADTMAEVIENAKSMVSQIDTAVGELPGSTTASVQGACFGMKTQLEAAHPVLFTAAENAARGILRAVDTALGFDASSGGIMETKGSLAISGFIQGMNGRRSETCQTIGSIMNGVKAAAGTVSFEGVGHNVIGGIMSGLNERKASLMETAGSIAAAISTKIRSALKINSPSKVMIPVGEAITEGMELGLEHGAVSLYNTASAISSETAEALGELSRSRTSSVVYPASFGNSGKLDRLLEAVEKLADSQTTMEIDGRPFGRLVREYV